VSQRTSFCVVISTLFLVLLLPVVASAQEAYTSETDEYTRELPTQTRKALPRTDSAYRHTEYINADRADGYLRVRRALLTGDTNLSE
jgi:hypothetical protein